MVIPADKQRAPNPIHHAVSSPTGGKEMGLVYAEIELVSGDDLALHRHGIIQEEKIKRVAVKALVDSGAYMLVINDHIKEQLGLVVLEERIAKLADDTERRVDVVGPIEIRFENRRTIANAIVFSSTTEVLLGSIPMEDLDVLIDPKKQRLIVNPENPNIPLTYVK